MKDEDKTKEQPIDELAQMRQRIAQLEALEVERRRAEKVLKSNLDYLEKLSSSLRIWAKIGRYK